MDQGTTTAQALGSVVGGDQGASPAELTPRQIQILRWLDENPTNGARWLVDGKPIRKQSFDKWNTWEISGPNGSIRMSLADNIALRDFIGSEGFKGNLFIPSERGRAAIAKAEGRE